MTLLFSSLKSSLPLYPSILKDAGTGGGNLKRILLTKRFYNFLQINFLFFNLQVYK
jgi:hypothetical protein